MFFRSFTFFLQNTSYLHLVYKDVFTYPGAPIKFLKCVNLCNLYTCKKHVFLVFLDVFWKIFKYFPLIGIMRENEKKQQKMLFLHLIRAWARKLYMLCKTTIFDIFHVFFIL